MDTPSGVGCSEPNTTWPGWWTSLIQSENSRSMLSPGPEPNSLALGSDFFPNGPSSSPTRGSDFSNLSINQGGYGARSSQRTTTLQAPASSNVISNSRCLKSLNVFMYVAFR